MNLKKHLLFLGLVLMLSCGFSQTNTIVPEKEAATKLPQFRTELNFGLGKILGKNTGRTEFEKQYQDKLLKGTNVDFSVTYFFEKHFGLGVKFGLFSSSNAVSDVVVIFPDGTKAFGKVSDHISMRFFGPNLVCRFPNMRNANTIIISLAVGRLNYEDKAVVINPIIIKGSTYGGCFNLGYDFALADNFSVGASASYWGGILTSVDVTQNGQTKKINVTSEDAMNLSRVTGSIGFKYSL